MDEQQINALADKIGNVLIDNGIKIKRSAYHLEPTKSIGVDFQLFLNQKLPGVILKDGTYYLIPFSQWKTIIENDWTHLRKWYKEIFDCDKFARVFQAHIFELFEINSVGEVYGRVYVAADGTFIDYHEWDCIVSQEADGKHIYMLEPMSNQWIEYKGGSFVIGAWKYEVVSVRF